MDYIDYKSANIKASTMESLIEFKEAHKPHDIPETVIWSHGLSAVNTKTSASSHLEGVQDILGTGREISCGKYGDEKSHGEFKWRACLGPIGIYVQGHCSLMSCDDMGSVSIDGKRYPRNFEAQFVETIEELNSSAYNEALIAPEKIIGGWVRKDILDDMVSANPDTYYEGYDAETSQMLFEEELVPKRDNLLECIAAMEAAGIPIEYI